MYKTIVCLLAALALLSTTAQAQQSLRVMAATSPPYVDRKLPEEGLALELLRHIFSRTSYNADIVIENNWARAVEGTTIGVYDALGVAWYSEERNQSMLFSKPYLGGELIIVKPRNNPERYYQLKDLAGGRLGVQVDYAYEIDFSQVPNLRLVEENHLIQNLLNLLAGKVDFVIGDRRTMSQQMKEFLGGSISRFQVIDAKLPQRPRHLAVSRDRKDHAEVVAAFNKALAEVREDGSYDAIVRKWDERYGVQID